jgi:hypothetical protein
MMFIVMITMRAIMFMPTVTMIMDPVIKRFVTC